MDVSKGLELKKKRSRLEIERKGEGEVQSIPEKTEGEDCRGEGIAGQTGVSIEKLCEGFMMVLWM